MKFLIAASFLCIALFGQAQGGSLRGFSVGVPHQQYGVPLLSSDRNHHQAEEIKKPNDDNQSAMIINNVESTTSRPFIDHLPLVDSAVNFGAVVINDPVTQRPELPLLQPGLPSLPAAPIIPTEPAVQARVVVPSNSYLPPAAQEVSNDNSLSKQKQPILQLIQQVRPVSPIGALVQAGAQLSNVLLPPRPAFPFVPSSLIPSIASLSPLAVAQPIQTTQQLSTTILPSGLPALPVAPVVPVNTVAIQQPTQTQPELMNTYLPPKPELPAASQVPLTTPIQAQPELPLLPPGLPALPKAPVVPVTPVAIEQPSHSQPELMNTYLPPKPELPILQPGLPSLPAAPQVPLTTPIQAQPELPLLPPGLPALPEAPVVPVTPIAIEQPAQAQPELMNTYLPPKPELPTLQPGFPSLPAAPQLQLTIPIQAQPELLNTYLPPKPELPTLQPGFPSLPAAPQVQLTIPIQAQPELPLLPPGLPALPEAPIVPVNIPQPSPVVLIEEQKPVVHEQIQQIQSPSIEIPALPQAPIIPASTQLNEDSNIGYEYNRPTPPSVETAQIPEVQHTQIVHGSSQVITGQVPVQKPILLLNLYPDFFSNLGILNNPGQIQPNLPQIPSLPLQQFPNLPLPQIPNLPLPQIPNLPIPQIPAENPVSIPQLPVQGILPALQFPVQGLLPGLQFPGQAPVQAPQQTSLPVQQTPSQLPQQQSVIVQQNLPAQQVLLQPSLPPQQAVGSVFVESKIEGTSQNGYSYSPPSQPFLLPNQY